MLQIGIITMLLLMAAQLQFILFSTCQFTYHIYAVVYGGSCIEIKLSYILTQNSTQFWTTCSHYAIHFDARALISICKSRFKNTTIDCIVLAIVPAVAQQP